MAIDFKATRHKMRMIKIGMWARENDLSEATVRKILYGDYAGFGPKAEAVIVKLREHGFLVEVADEGKAA